VRSRHRRPERNFGVIAGKIIGAAGEQRRFVVARNSSSSEPFKDVLARAGVTDRTPTTVLFDGDTGLQRLQRRVLPEATVVLDWFHIAMRFEHALQTATGLGAGTTDAYLSRQMRHDIERAKWRLWHGRWKGCLIKLSAIRRWTEAKSIDQIAGAGVLRRHLDDLLAYLEANQTGLVDYGARRRRGEPISTAFVER